MDPVVPTLPFERQAPHGFRYVAELISSEDERAVAAQLRQISFVEFTMRGVVARRRVAFFGEAYNSETAAPLPSFLTPLRDTVAAWAGVDPSAFAMALVNEYTPGTPIGWHRDAPRYDVVAGVSLLAPCRM